METTTLRTSKSVAQTELQQLKETLRKLSMADDPHMNQKINSLLEPTNPMPFSTSSDNQMTFETYTKESISPANTSPTEMKFTTPMIPVHTNGNSSFSNAPSNSKAVLSALKALQDKVRRVEEEKTALEAQFATVKAQLRSNEAQQLSASRKAEYEIQQVKDAAHAAYEALKSEKESLASDLNQEKHKLDIKQNELDHANDLLISYKEKAENANVHARSVEDQLVKVQSELAGSNQESKERIMELQEAVHSANRSGKEATRKIQSLEEQLQRAMDANTNLESRLHDAEKTVAQMSQLNEKLVTNMYASKAPKKKPSTKKAAPVPTQTASRSTVASRAGTANRASVPITQTKSVPKKKKVPKRSSSSTTTNKQQLEQANMGHVPFLLGKSTAPSFSVIGNVQEALRQSDSYHAVAPDIHQVKVKKDSTKKLSIEPVGYHEDIDVATERQGPLIFEGDPEKPTKEAFMTNISKAVKSVEREFEQLNEQYKVLVSQVDTNPNVSKSIEKTIDELEAKGEQLYLLKQLQAQASKSSIFAARRVLHSPDAADKKVAALRVLNEYRKLDREIKTRSPRRSHHLHQD